MQSLGDLKKCIFVASVIIICLLINKNERRRLVFSLITFIRKKKMRLQIQIG